MELEKREQPKEQSVTEFFTPKDDSKLAELAVIAQAFAYSGYFKDFDATNARKGAAQALVKILRGQDLGISPSAAIESIYIIDNSTAMSAHLMSALIRRSGADFVISTHTSNKCEITFYSHTGRSKEMGKSSFTIEEAGNVKFWDKFKKTWKTLLDKDNWKNFQKDMLYARAMSRGFRHFFSHLAMGAVFTPEELHVQSMSSKEEVTQELVDKEQELYESLSQGPAQPSDIDVTVNNDEQKEDSPNIEPESPPQHESQEVEQETQQAPKPADEFSLEVLMVDLRNIFGDVWDTPPVSEQVCSILSLIVPTPTRNDNPVQPVTVTDVRDLDDAQVKRAIKVIGRLRKNKKYKWGRIGSFLSFCLDNHYLINTSRSVDAAVSEFISFEESMAEEAEQEES